ncbi:MAG: DUF357 domain-containing protein [archaeon]
MNKSEEKARRYISSIRVVLSDLVKRIPILTNDAQFIVDTAQRYVKDAQYYLERGDSSTALASVSYAEGLLDALKFLKIADFNWPYQRTDVHD